MSNAQLTYETVINLALRLSPQDRARLIAQLAPTLVESAPAPQPKRSSYGVLADLALDLSADDIDAARRELWSGFPREDVGS